MNERIQELAEQATSIVEMVGPQGYTSSYAKFDREKFAELIVRECVATMYKHGEIYAHPSAGFYQAKIFSKAIMEHFGVEE